MNKLIAYFIKFPIWANAVIVVTAIAGILSLFIMPKSFFPEMTPNRVYINVAYPGASPKEIEEGITTKVEESLNGIQGVKEITSTSSENISSITVTGIEGIDLDKMLQDVKNAVDGISQFPAGAEKPLVFAQTSRGMGGLSNVVGFYSLYGPDDLWKLKETAEKVEQELLASKEISQIDIVGYPPVIIAVDIRENDLLKYGLDFTTISNIVKMSNIDLSGGGIKTDNEEIIIRSMNRSTDPDKVKEIVILALPTGDIVKLKDIADVSMEFSEIPMKNYVNGKRGVSFIVKKTTDEDLDKIADEMSAYIEKFNNEQRDFEMLSLFQRMKT